jgi:hypothetical protein
MNGKHVGVWMALVIVCFTVTYPHSSGGVTKTYTDICQDFRQLIQIPHVHKFKHLPGPEAQKANTAWASRPQAQKDNTAWAWRPQAQKDNINCLDLGPAFLYATTMFLISEVLF